jgi:uncharacterized protein
MEKNRLLTDKVFIDTLFIVALINKYDQYHEIAKRLSDQYEGQLFVTTDAVILEIGNALSRNFKQQSVQIIEYLLSSEDVEVVHLEPNLFNEAFELYKAYQDKDWGLVDCISFAVIKDRSIKDALTCDRHFIQAGFRALMT